MSEAMSGLARKGLALLILAVAAYVLLKAVIGIVVGVLWIVVIVAAVIGVLWAWSVLSRG
jgi:hypothetical protein